MNNKNVQKSYKNIKKKSGITSTITYHVFFELKYISDFAYPLKYYFFKNKEKYTLNDYVSYKH